ncbi:hypothetical protein [Bifidobacterium oedipodis]|uniref:Efflux ABC transporter permease n=1 Tax=Bifidobacterium oedipodis TaxID=2675322 RepID=A0A7Y0EMW7_9BIFI|nr:hypothetical protein [Bifidobacterium sp. DSM 109957]NMM93215.1 efflux ABC transporter permease [Bifidobacterium sp. DSM 109957]
MSRSTRRITSAVGRGYTRSHAVLCILMIAICICCSAVQVAFAQGLAQYVTAVEDGVRAEFGGYAYQISGGSDAAVQALNRHVTQGDAIAVMRMRGAVASADGRLATSGDVTLMSGPSRYGRLIQGRQPQTERELSLSREACSQIGATIGDTIELRLDDMPSAGGKYTVTGVTVNPATLSDVSIVTVTEADNLSDAQMWLSDTAIADTGVLLNEASHGNIHVGREEGAVEEMKSSVLERVLPGNYLYALALGIAISLIYAIMFIALYTSGHCNGRRVEQALNACGFSAKQSRRIILRHAVLTTIVSIAVGIMVGACVMWLFHTWFGELFDQLWRWNIADALAGTCMAMVCLALGWALSVVALFRSRTEHVETLEGKTRAYRLCGIALCIVGLALLASYHLWVPAVQGKIGALMAAAGLMAVLMFVPYLRLTPIQQRVALRSRGYTVPLCVLVALVCSFASAISAENMLAATSTSNEGKFSVNNINARDVEYLQSTYPQAMADALVFFKPDDGALQIRVPDPTSFDCLADSDVMAMDCYYHDGDMAQDMVLFAQPGTEAGKLIGYAKPNLIDAQNQVGIIGVDVSDPNAEAEPIVFSMQVPVTGGNHVLRNDDDVMPGVVLDTSSPVLEQDGVEMSDSRLLILPTFGSLPDETKNAIRSDVIVRAGYALVVEDDSTERRQMESMAIGVAILVSLANLIIIAVCASAALSTQRQLRDDMWYLGASRWQLARLVTPLALPVGLGSMTASIMGWLASHPWIIQPEWTQSVTGWWWLMPSVVALVCCALLYGVASLPPRSSASHA